MSKLTIKQKNFADEYIISGNASAAARKAGYSPKYINSNVQKLLQNTAVKMYIGERMREIQQKKIANQEEVLQYLTRIIRGEERDETLISDGSEIGQRITKIGVSARDRIKAAELLGKRYGLWTDKLEIEAETVVIRDDIDE
ncbi:MAG: terminase small subunit [Ezakiella sp.]|nr:terminase small subunit [Ezakiella sp.]